MNLTMQDAHNTEYGVAPVKPRSRVKLVVLLVVGLEVHVALLASEGCELSNDPQIRC
jgi:hypothetical protein